MSDTIISPSILAADFSKLGDEIKKLDDSSCEWVHFDVMDGHFVPNLSFGAPIIKSVRNLSQKVFDVHLMMEYPLDYLDDFVDAGSDYITIHFECEQVKKMGLKYCLNLIKSKGIKAGVAIQPTSDVANLISILPYCDLVLIMSVNAGFGGQSFIDSTLMKISMLKNLINELNHNILISVDGGINDHTRLQCVEAGANVLVAGSFIFNGNYENQIRLLK